MTSWKYTSEMTEWIRKNSNGVEWDDLTPQFNEMFGCDKTARQLRSHAHDNGIHNGIFKQSPTKHGRPVGSKRLDKDGYVVVKIADPCKWRREQFVVWEQYNEPIDINKEAIMHLDGNRQNNSIENLRLIERRYIAILNSHIESTITPNNFDSMYLLAKTIYEKRRAEIRLYGSEREATNRHNNEVYHKRKSDRAYIAHRRELQRKCYERKANRRTQ